MKTSRVGVGALADEERRHELGLRVDGKPCPRVADARRDRRRLHVPLLLADERPQLVQLQSRAWQIDHGLVEQASQPSPTRARSVPIVSRSTPVMRAVERSEQPSVRAATTATCFDRGSTLAMTYRVILIFVRSRASPTKRPGPGRGALAFPSGPLVRAQVRRSGLEKSRWNFTATLLRPRHWELLRPSARGSLYRVPSPRKRAWFRPPGRSPADPGDTGSSRFVGLPWGLLAGGLPLARL